MDLALTDKQKDIYDILLENEFNGFTKDSINIEKAKAAAIKENLDKRKAIFSLEEHEEIQGNTGNFKLDSDNFVAKAQAFNEIWHKNTKNGLIIRAFLTAGDYSVMTHSYSALGEIGYFGNRGYWNRILTTTDKGEKVKITDSLDAFLSNYLKLKGNTAQKLNYLIDIYKSKIKDWRYHFIKYEQITADNYHIYDAYYVWNLFAWQEEEGFNIHKLGNSGKQPLRSYHINPYLITVKDHFNVDERVTLLSERHSETSFISIADKVKLSCYDSRWIVSPFDDYEINEQTISEFNIEETDDYFLLEEQEGYDRIEIAVKFIEAFLKES